MGTPSQIPQQKTATKSKTDKPLKVCQFLSLIGLLSLHLDNRHLKKLIAIITF